MRDTLNMLKNGDKIAPGQALDRPCTWYIPVMYPRRPKSFRANRYVGLCTLRTAYAVNDEHGERHLVYLLKVDAI